MGYDMERRKVLDDLKYAIENHQKFFIKEKDNDLIIAINKLIFVIPNGCYEVFNSQLELKKYIDNSIKIPWIEYLLNRKDLHNNFDEMVLESESFSNGITVLKSENNIKSVYTKYLKYFNNPYFYISPTDSLVSVYEKRYDPKDFLNDDKTIKPEDLIPVGLIPII